MSLCITVCILYNIYLGQAGQVRSGWPGQVRLGCFFYLIFIFMICYLLNIICN